MTDFPPFAPTLDAEREQAALMLSQAERKRTGHLYKDCPALDVVAPGRNKGCKPCLARWQDVGRLAKFHQQQYDAAWYAQAAKEDAPMNLEAEKEMWADIVRQDAPGSHVMPRIDAAEAYVPPTHRAAVTNQPKPNRFGGKCQACSQWVEPQAGRLTGSPGKWGVLHLEGACPAPKPALAVPAAPLTPGMYRQPSGRIVRVQVARTSGKPYAKTVDGQYPGGGRELDGLVRLTLDEAKAYGRETGVCCVCSAELTNPDSIAAGIGPICAQGF